MKNLKIILCGVAFVLSGCGGGEGGSDGIDFDPGSLSFVGAAGQSISSKSVDVNVGFGSSKRYVGVNNKNPELASVSYKITHIDAFSMTITPAASRLGKGTHSGAVDALVCDDSACRDVIDRGTFKYTITIN